ncbi:MAG: phosphatidylinositol-3-phosphatase [Actinomycetota bacterium]|jgi:chitodextrinase|nr:phosphatidylinositol-3-phosphatase [Actinomycetota bacterium]
MSTQGQIPHRRRVAAFGTALLAAAAFGLVVVPATSASVAITYVQGAALDTGARVPSAAVQLTDSVGAADLLVGWFSEYNAAGTVQVSDTVNGAWTRGPAAETFGTAGGDIALYYVQNSLASPGGVSINITSSAPAYLQGAVAEYSGVATTGALDQVAFAAGSGTAVDSGPTAPVAAGDLVFSALVTGGSPGSETPGASQGSSYAPRSTMVGGTSYAQDVTSAAAGPQNGRATLAMPTDWYAVVAAFRPVPAPSLDPTPPSAPADLTASNITSKSVLLNWKASIDNVPVTAYTVLRNGAPIATTTSTTYTDVAVSAFTQYTYTVTASNDAGQTSPPSNAVAVAAPAASPPISYVQGASFATGARVSSSQVQLGSAVRGGDLLVGWFSQYNAAGVLQVSDSVNGAWTRGPASETFGAGGGDIALYYVQNSLAAPGGLSITVTPPAPAYLEEAVGEYSGVATTGALDQVASAAGFGTAVDSGATAPVGSGDLVFSALVTGGWPGEATPGTSQGLASAPRSTVGSGAAYGQDITSSAAGPQNGRATLAMPTDWYAVVAAFHPAQPHVMVIVMENHSYNDVIGSPAAPYINSLAAQYASLTNWVGVSHPSLPNYLALTDGETQAPGPPDCVPLWSTQAAPSCTYDSARDNLAHQLTSAGVGWRAYLEGLPAACDLSSSFGPNGYDVNHNPFAYYDTVRNYAAECNSVVPYPQMATDLATNAAPPFLYVAPNVAHDMHDGTVQDGDTWLQSMLATVFASPWYAQHGTVIVTWDEGLATEGVATLIVSDALKGSKNRGNLNTFGNHFGTLRSLEEVYGLPLLNNAANAANGDIASLLGG